MWGAPLLDRTKDYIAEPKPNGYASIHLTMLPPPVVSFQSASVSQAGGVRPDGIDDAEALVSQCMELQIRTRRMDDLAEAGEASHSAYKGGLDSRQARQLRDWTHQLRKRLSAAGGAAAVAAASGDVGRGEGVLMGAVDRRRLDTSESREDVVGEAARCVWPQVLLLLFGLGQLYPSSKASSSEDELF